MASIVEVGAEGVAGVAVRGVAVAAAWPHAVSVEGVLLAVPRLLPRVILEVERVLGVPSAPPVSVPAVRRLIIL